MSVSEYVSLWEGTAEEVVVCGAHDQDYPSALQAAVLASFRHSPLLLLDESNVLEFADFLVGRDVIKIGAVDAAVTNTLASANSVFPLSSAQAQHECLLATNTDNVILVGSVDLQEYIEESFKPSMGSYKLPSIHRLYGHASLAGAILAATRRALLVDAVPLVPVEFLVPGLLDAPAVFEEHGLKLRYLSIVASPNIILMTKQEDTNAGEKESFALDPFTYADLDQDGFPELGVGRLLGLTVADVSASVARALFYSLVVKDANSAKLISSPYAENSTWFAEVFNAYSKAMKVAGWDVSHKALLNLNDVPVTTDWEHAAIVAYLGHGSTTPMFTPSSLPKLSSTNLLLTACNVADWDELKEKKNYFPALALRAGAVSLIAATDTNAGWDSWRYLTSLLGTGASTGDAFRFVKCIGASWMLGSGKNDYWYVGNTSDDNPYYMLFGDPVFRPYVPSPLPQVEFQLCGPKCLAVKGSVMFFKLSSSAPEPDLVLCSFPILDTGLSFEMEVPITLGGLDLSAVSEVEVSDAEMLTNEGTKPLTESDFNEQSDGTLWFHGPTLVWKPVYESGATNVAVFFKFK